MGTRGFVGFVVDGTEKIGYTHWGAHPDGVGIETLTRLRYRLIESNGLADLTKQATALRVVSPDSQATDEDVQRLSRFADLSVSSRNSNEWYVLLRHTQGDIDAILAAGVVEDSAAFANDSLFCEWGFLVDLDAGVFEAYEGFQQAAHDRGRFADRSEPGTGYAPVALRASWPLDALPDDKTFLGELDAQPA